MANHRLNIIGLTSNNKFLKEIKEKILNKDLEKLMQAMLNNNNVSRQEIFLKYLMKLFNANNLRKHKLRLKKSTMLHKFSSIATKLQIKFVAYKKPSRKANNNQEKETNKLWDGKPEDKPWTIVLKSTNNTWVSYKKYNLS